MPPLSVIVAVPVANPQPGCTIFIICDKAGGDVIVAVAVTVQLFKAFTVTVYIPLANPVAAKVVCVGVVLQL